MLAAGLAGVEENLKLAPPHSGDAYFGAKLPEVPKTLRAATEALTKSKMLRAALGDGVVDHYVRTAEWEQFEYDRRITDWELMRGFETDWLSLPGLTRQSIPEMPFCEADGCAGQARA